MEAKELNTTDTVPQKYRHLTDAVLNRPPVLFRSFTREDLSGFFDSGVPVEYVMLEEIKPNGLPESEVTGYLVLEGMIEVRRNGFVIEEFRPGDFIGESFLHVRNMHRCELRAQMSSVVLMFNRAPVLEFFRNRPEKLLRIFTLNVIESQHRHIYNLYLRIAECAKQREEK